MWEERTKLEFLLLYVTVINIVYDTNKDSIKILKTENVLGIR